MNSEVTLSFPGSSFRPCAPVRTATPVWTALVFCAILPCAAHATLIWENNIGTPLTNFTPDGSNGTESVSLGASYGFQFEGATVSTINVATSGFVWLGNNNTAQCCVLGNSSAALNAFEQGPARIIPGWADLRLDLGGSVDFNQITDASGSRTVLTYLQVPTGPSTNVSFQLQLYTTGEIIFSYLTFNGTSLGSNPAVVLGLTSGGDFSPNMFDFTSLQPGSPMTVTGSSIYDYIPVTNSLNLSGDSFILTPTPPGTPAGFTVAAAGAPEPATWIPAGAALILFAFIRTARIRINS